MRSPTPRGRSGFCDRYSANITRVDSMRRREVSSLRGAAEKGSQCARIREGTVCHFVTFATPSDSTRILDRLLGSDSEDAMRPTTPTVLSVSGDTSSSEAVFWRAKSASCDGLSIARIMADRDCGRPSRMGVTVPGNRMMSRRGITGRPSPRIAAHSSADAALAFSEASASAWAATAATAADSAGTG